jgi:hyperosmotically inducible protein
MQKSARPLLFVGLLALAIAQAGCSKTPDAGTAPMAAASSDIGNISDVDVTEHVKTALHQNAMLQPFDITVLTIKGDVRLIGTLDNRAQITEALKVARAAQGVHSIYDELTLKP